MVRKLALLLACAAGCRSVSAEPPPGDASPIDAPLGFATERQVFARAPAVGLEVHLEDVRIASKAGRGLWIEGGRGRRQVFVVPIDPSQVEMLAPGARIDVRGTLRSSPSARQAALELGVGMRAARRIAASPHYIDAWAVTEPM